MNNRALEKPKIEEIYPLNTIQNGILLHHLVAKEDQGFLNVQCTIDGNIDVDTLEKSWEDTIKRHEVLRTSIHWEKIKKPVQIVRPTGSMKWHFLDWSHESEDTFENKLIQLRNDNKALGINLNKAPLSKIFLIKKNENSHYLIWCCHHILLDGWSTSIILKDVFTYYDSYLSGIPVNLHTIPSYKSYLGFLKQADSNAAKKYWSKVLGDFETPTLIGKEQFDSNNLEKTELSLSNETTRKVKELTKEFKITANTLFQAFWGVILNKYSNTRDICFGNTVSGRSGDFPNIELMAGMFANVLPTRITIPDELLKDWLRSFQRNQMESRAFEHLSVEEISNLSNKSNIELFDSLFIFENYPWEAIEKSGLTIHSPKSGITTTYPLTMIVKIEDCVKLFLISNSLEFDKKTRLWLINRFEELINTAFEDQNISVFSLLKNIQPINKEKEQLNEIRINNNTSNSTNAKNKIELELLRLWQNVLSKKNIGTEDNFFEIGGKSLAAVRLISKINDELNVQFSPTILLEHSSIVSLAKLITNNKKIISENWNNLVALKPQGSKPPVFCLHAGGGHVFFYNDLAKYIDKDRPIYAIKPSGLFGKLNRHENIKDMAADYIKEIQLAYPQGPYNLLVYCHSTAVGYEMTKTLKNSGFTANLIIADTMAEQEHMNQTRIKMRVFGFLKRLSRNPISVINNMISFRFKKYVGPFFTNIFGSEEAKNTSKTAVNLINVYNDYKWESANLEVSLILTDKVNEMFNEETISSWENLVNKVNIIKTKGDHRTLFEKPDIKYMAKSLGNYLDSIEV